MTANSPAGNTARAYPFEPDFNGFVNTASRTASAVPLAVPLVVDGPDIPFRRRGGGNVQNSPDLQRDWATVSLDAIGGEPLTGSGFQTEEPALGFSSADLRGEE